MDILLSRDPEGFFADDFMMSQVAKVFGYDLFVTGYTSRLAAKEESHPFNGQAFFRRLGDQPGKLFSSRRLLELRAEPKFIELWNSLSLAPSTNCRLELVSIPDKGVEYEIIIDPHGIETVVERHRRWSAPYGKLTCP